MSSPQAGKVFTVFAKVKVSREAFGQLEHESADFFCKGPENT